MSDFDKYFAKFTKHTLHQGGSVPFWDWRYSGRLKIETPKGIIIELGAAEIISLKKLLAGFDSRTGKWKNADEKSSVQKDGDGKSE